MRLDTLLRRLREAKARIVFGDGRPRLRMPPEVLDRLRPDIEEHRDQLALEVAAKVLASQLSFTELLVGWWTAPIYGDAHLLRGDAFKDADLIAWCGRPLPEEWKVTERKGGTVRRLPKVVGGSGAAEQQASTTGIEAVRRSTGLPPGR